MFPYHGYMGPYQQPPRDQLPPFACYPYPSFPVTPHMYVVDAPNSTYPSPCSFDGNPTYPSKVECNGCCLHEYPSRYFSMPPFPPYQHPFYAQYPHMYPHHFHPCCVPPTPYEFNRALNNTEQGKQRFCGFPNHPINLKDKNISKIQGDTKDGQCGDGNSPTQISGYHHPIIWFPPKVNNSGNDVKPVSQPEAWSAWCPSSLKGLMEGKEEEKGKDEKDQWRFPIIWTPNHQGYSDSSGQVDKDVRELRASPIIEEVPQSKSKIIQVKHPPTDCDSKTTIPVNQLNSLNTVTPTSTFPKQETKKESKTDQVLKSQKPSKLPPVCLRVDPLPRRKDGKGSSRSNSPPNHMENVQDNKKTNPFDMEKNADKANSEGRVIEVKHKVEGSNKDNQVDEASKRSSVKVIPVEEVLTESAKVDVVNSRVRTSVGEKKSDRKEGTEARMDSADTRTDNDKGKNKNRSKSDAAVIIQAAYRGFQVRRWEPLKKLKQIGTIRKQVCDIKDKIEAASRRPLDSKERVVIGETVMNLLLQLDTVQGLHSSVREIRKSVARELVLLQEKVDSLANQGADCGTRSEEEAVPSKQEEQLEKETSGSVHHAHFDGHKENQELPAVLDEDMVADCRDSPVCCGAEDQNAQEVTQLNEVDSNSNGTIVMREVSLLEEQPVTLHPQCEEPRKLPESISAETEEQNAQKVTQSDGVDSNSELGDGTIAMQEGSPLEEQLVTLHTQCEEPSKLPESSSVETEERIEALVDTTMEVRHIEGDEELNKLPQEEEHSGAPIGIVSEHTQLDEPVVCEGLVTEEDAPRRVEADTTELQDCKMDTLNEPVAGCGSCQHQVEVDELLPSIKESHVGSEQHDTVELEASASHPEGMLPEQEREEFDEHATLEGTLEPGSANGEEVRTSSVEDGSTNAGNGCDEMWIESKRARDGVGEDSLAAESCREPEIVPVPAVKEEEEAAAEAEAEVVGAGRVPEKSTNGEEKRLAEENVHLQEALRELLDRGKEQMDVISDLTGRVRDLERKLAHRRRLKLQTKWRRGSAFSRC